MREPSMYRNTGRAEKEGAINEEKDEENAPLLAGHQDLAPNSDAARLLGPPNYWPCNVLLQLWKKQIPHFLLTREMRFLTPMLRQASTMVAPRFIPSRLYNIEEIEDYQPGGYHPISIGDTFDQGRYRILHKLGFGGSSTVWLARDQ